MNLHLEHPEFVHRYRNNELQCSLIRPQAVGVFDGAHQTMRVAGWLLLLTGLMMLCMTAWWKAAPCLVLGLILHKGFRDAARGKVVEMALSDPLFYEQMVSQGIIAVREQPAAVV